MSLQLSTAAKQEIIWLRCECYLKIKICGGVAVLYKSHIIVNKFYVNSSITNLRFKTFNMFAALKVKIDKPTSLSLL